MEEIVDTGMQAMPTGVSPLSGADLAAAQELWLSDSEELDVLWDRMQELARAGATSESASSSQKLEIGDCLSAMRRLEDRIRKRVKRLGVTVSPEDVALADRCRERTDAFLSEQPVHDHTLMDYSRVAKALGEGSAVRRSGLSFGHLRALVTAEPKRREYWASQAVTRNLSVNALRSELTAERGITGPNRDGRRNARTFVCAQTGRPITDLNAMVTLQVHLPTDAKPRGAAAVHSRNAGDNHRYMSILRFVDAAALAEWLVTHRHELPKATREPSAESLVPRA